MTRKRVEFRSFEDARTYVRTLGLKSEDEWRKWKASGARPHDIPSTPAKTYKSSGWLSIGDFLGYDKGKRAQRATASTFRSFEDARTYVRTLGLKSVKEWLAWSKSGARPHDIPSKPALTYASSGWLSIGDFLGYAVGKHAKKTKDCKFRTFEAAREYVRTFGLKGTEEWEAWRKSGARPHDIPSDPYAKYVSSGWLSYGDFLGYAVGKHAKKSKECKFRTFEAAREYVRTLGLKSVMEWREWRKSGARPHDIPSKPAKTYASSGWLSIGDFLGYEGNVTGAYKRNAAVAGLRALLDNDANNDEKDEQDEDDEDEDEDARRRKQAKRPRDG
ncbi:methyltransferase domain-containing protein [Pycnococcus provasolii]